MSPVTTPQIGVSTLSYTVGSMVLMIVVSCPLNQGDRR